MITKFNYYFFRCYHCGSWYYSKKVIINKKCLKCNRSFGFQKSTKFSKQCSQSEAIAIIKELKKRMYDEDLSKYLSNNRKFPVNKISSK